MKYEPHEYQRYAINYIEDHPFAAVLLDMGLGKTSITLTAIADLLFDSFEVHKVLVIAPLRVARDTWSAELQKWDQLHHLTYSVAVGSEAERKAALTKKADIYIINRENVQWLIEKSKLPFDYDMVVVDELSSFKSHKAKRFKALAAQPPEWFRSPVYAPGEIFDSTAMVDSMNSMMSRVSSSMTSSPSGSGGGGSFSGGGGAGGGGGGSW